MRCFGQFLNDRICDLCETTNRSRYIHCKQKHQNKLDKQSKLREIAYRCSFRKSCWDEYNNFQGCTKDGDKGRHTPDCKPSLGCEKYCKERVNDI